MSIERPDCSAATGMLARAMSRLMRTYSTASGPGSPKTSVPRAITATSMTSCMHTSVHDAMLPVGSRHRIRFDPQKPQRRSTIFSSGAGHEGASCSGRPVAPGARSRLPGGVLPGPCAGHRLRAEHTLSDLRPSRALRARRDEYHLVDELENVTETGDEGGDQARVEAQLRLEGEPVDSLQVQLHVVEPLTEETVVAWPDTSPVAGEQTLAFDVSGQGYARRIHAGTFPPDVVIVFDDGERTVTVPVMQVEFSQETDES
ncbi:hypothetical protein ACFFF6_10170 [Brachybacterium hainanense]|uniref:Uncharacterized protein n=2 Tax=Brachybacterium hainanense TaxID=1541174 RepID=A0ABV6REG3_9MICO